VLIVLAACGGRQPSSHVTANDAVVYLKSNVTDAQVYVDGRFLGPVSALRGGIAFDPGRHRFELRRDDYFSGYVEVDLRRAERRQLSLDLAPVLP
jgi:hypothetical protein